MPRPRKENADYFPHNAGERNNRAIKPLRQKFGLEGYAVWMMLQEALCEENGIRIKDTKQERILLVGDFDIDLDRFEAILDFLVEIGLIQRVDGHLECAHLMQKLQPLIQRREQKRAKLEKESASFDVQNPAKPPSDDSFDRQNPSKTPKETSIGENNPSKTHKRRVEESKVEESKQDQRREEKKREDSIEPKNGSPPNDVEEVVAIAGTFLLNTGKPFEITEEQAAKFQQLYPAVDVRQELRSIEAWCLSNSKKRKTKGGALKFVNNWLSRAQNKGFSNGSHQQAHQRGHNRQGGANGAKSGGGRPKSAYEERTSGSITEQEILNHEAAVSEYGAIAERYRQRGD